jgi:hypothetical protein
VRGGTLLVILMALVLGACSASGRAHFGDLWLQGGHGLAEMGSHVAIALH